LEILLLLRTHPIDLVVCVSLEVSSSKAYDHRSTLLYSTTPTGESETMEKEVHFGV
jgi:hypothetical protein